jgi:hypothetical protein
LSSNWQTRASRILTRAQDWPALAVPYDQSNINDDHGRDGRRDYSVLLLAAEVMTLTVTAAAWGGPWTTRRTGTLAVDSAWTARRQASLTTPVSAWAARRPGTGTTATAGWAARRSDTITTNASAWATRREGTGTT